MRRPPARRAAGVDPVRRKVDPSPVPFTRRQATSRDLEMPGGRPMRNKVRLSLSTQRSSYVNGHRGARSVTAPAARSPKPERRCHQEHRACREEPGVTLDEPPLL